MSELGDYVDRMRQRHPRLSMRQMALGAGLSASTVGAIIKADQGARPCTLKALANRWGSDEDYREMMRLAGHPIAGQVPQEFGAEARELLDLFERLLPGDQQVVLILTRTLFEQHSTDEDKVCQGVAARVLPNLPR